MEKLVKDGLDLITKTRVWIIPDYDNNTYKLKDKKQNPFVDASPIENAMKIMAITPPKRVQIPAPTDAPLLLSDNNIRKPKGKKKFVPLNMHSENNVSAPATLSPYVVSTKTWNKPNANESVSFSQVMAEQSTEPTMNENVAHVKPIHYAQKDMRKENQCPYGKACVKRDRPFACALNHDENGDIIKRGTELTEEILCPFERPPFQRCGDGRCTKVHLEHRAEFIEQKKQKFFSTEQQDKIKNTASDQEDDTNWDGPRTVFPVEKSSSSASTTDNEEDNEDLSDPVTFAARYNRGVVSL